MANTRIPQKCVLCGEKVVGWGYCERHYRRWRKHGDATKAKFQYFTSIWDDGFMPYFWQKVALTADDERCWEWQHTTLESGYGQIVVNHVFQRAHRVAWMLTHGRSTDLFILHSCDNRKCVNPRHLREGTNQDNMRDMVERGRSKAPRARQMNEETVRQVKEWFQQGVAVKDVAAQLGVSRSILTNIRTGRTWSHVTL